MDWHPTGKRITTMVNNGLKNSHSRNSSKRELTRCTAHPEQTDGVAIKSHSVSRPLARIPKTVLLQNSVTFRAISPNRDSDLIYFIFGSERHGTSLFLSHWVNLCSLHAGNGGGQLCWQKRLVLGMNPSTRKLACSVLMLPCLHKMHTLQNC